MSRIGKKPIIIPREVEVDIQANKVTVKGPQGSLEREFRPEIKIDKKDGLIEVSLKKTKERIKEQKAFWGLTRKLIYNMVEGAAKGFEKKLEIEGIGYKAEIIGEEIILSAGFSHPVKLKIPPGLKVSVEKNIITVFGADKELVGHLAALIRKVRPTEPYKGKGIKYQGEVVRRKAGKKVTAEK